jgi:cytochrome c-type biogenesis protein CcmF
MIRRLFRGIAIVVPAVVVGWALVVLHILNLGQVLTWVAFLASLVAGIAFLAATGGREEAVSVGRIAFRIQWLALLAAAVVLWSILFNHDFSYQYAANYSSRAMPSHYVYAAFWGGQEGTFLLWAFFTCTLGLFLMRQKSPLTWTAMLFLNLPLVMLGLVTAMRGAGRCLPTGRA